MSRKATLVEMPGIKLSQDLSPEVPRGHKRSVLTTLPLMENEEIKNAFIKEQKMT